MARKSVSRHLPPLAEVFPEFKGYPKEVNRSEYLREALAHIIPRFQSGDEVSFYAMREMAQYFGVSLKIVSDVYNVLNEQGLLTLVRGSKTIIPPTREAARHGVRAIVGIPIYLPSFVIGYHSRRFFIRLEEELRRLHYLANFIFYRDAEEPDPALAERILGHNLDALFWMTPTSAVKDCLLRAEDAGLRLCVLGDAKFTFPRQQYTLDLRSGYRQISKGWAQQGIKQIRILVPATIPRHSSLGAIVPCFKEVGIESKVEVVELAAISKWVRREQRKTGQGIVFPFHSHYEALCNHDHTAMMQLFATWKTFLAQGTLFHSSFQGQDIRVDSIRFDFEKIARTIAAEFATGIVWSRKTPKVFATRWDEHVDLGAVQRLI